MGLVHMAPVFGLLIVIALWIQPQAAAATRRALVGSATAMRIGEEGSEVVSKTEKKHVGSLISSMSTETEAGGGRLEALELSEIKRHERESGKEQDLVDDVEDYARAKTHPPIGPPHHK